MLGVVIDTDIKEELDDEDEPVYATDFEDHEE
jgi:hypothetical protein